MKYLVLFVCSMIIPAMNTSAVSTALSNNNVDLIFYIIDFGVFGWGIQRLKEKDEHPMGIILAVIAVVTLVTFAALLIISKTGNKGSRRR